MKISIGTNIKDGPWGGGNLFAINLKNYLEIEMKLHISRRIYFYSLISYQRLSHEFEDVYLIQPDFCIPLALDQILLYDLIDKNNLNPIFFFHDFCF